MKLRDYKTVQARRNALEKEVMQPLRHIGRYSLDEKQASSRHCENMIGVTQVPLGIAGPLKVQSVKGKAQSYYIPLATTEGALVASISRGCKAISQSGGAAVDSYRAGVTRGPVFLVKNLLENDALNTFLEKYFTVFQKITQQTSNHLLLTKFFSRGVGKYRYVRFVFDSQDAMGMNMATIATDEIVRFIKKEAHVHCISLAGNYDTDKKPSWLNVIEGRGIKAWAEITIPQKIIEETLKTTAPKIFQVWLAKCMMGSAMSGSMSYNAQFANVIAALFLATGQDLGHVGEGSLGITTTEVIINKNKTEDLYVSVYLPDLLVGTVGGGTGLASQKEALAILGVAGGNNGKNALRFAEIIAATVLAGEISLLASLSEGSLPQAHMQLARGGK